MTFVCTLPQFADSFENFNIFNANLLGNLPIWGGGEFGSTTFPDVDDEELFGFSLCNGMVKNRLHGQYFVFTCCSYGYGC